MVNPATDFRHGGLTRAVAIATIAAAVLGALWRGLYFGTFPGLDPDEVEGVLAWFRDPPIYWYIYPTERPHLNPLPPLLHWPVHALASPSAWTVRLPELLVGISAIPIVFVSLRRVFGSRTAALASVLVSAAPFLVAYSRQAWDLAYVPAFSAMVIGAAFARRRWLAAGLAVFSVLVHPTMVCLLPIAAAPTVVDFWRQASSSTRATWRRSLVMIGAALAYFAAFLGLMLLAAKLPLTIESASTLLGDIQRRASDWPLVQTFFSCYLHVMTGVLVYAEFLGTAVALDSMWPAVVVPAIFGASAWLLWRQGQKDRFVYLVALLLGIAGQFMTTGVPDLLIPLKERYFLWAALPTCVALVFLFEAFADSLRKPAVSIALVAVVATGWFVSFQLEYFTPFSRWGGESASLDYRAAAVQPKAQVLEIVSRNRRAQTGPVQVFVGEPRLHLVLQYLASGDPSWRILNLGRVLYQHQTDNTSDLANADVMRSPDVFFVDYVWNEVTGDIREVHALSERPVESVIAPWRHERIGTVTTAAGSPLFGVWRLLPPAK